MFVDVRYNDDGVVERGVSVARRLKKRGDPPDFGSLLSLLREVEGFFVTIRRRFSSRPMCFAIRI